MVIIYNQIADFLSLQGVRVIVMYVGCLPTTMFPVKSRYVAPLLQCKINYLPTCFKIIFEIATFEIATHFYTCTLAPLKPTWKSFFWKWVGGRLCDWLCINCVKAAILHRRFLLREEVGICRCCTWRSLCVKKRNILGFWWTNYVGREFYDRVPLSLWGNK